VTNDQGVLRQSTYYPYARALRHARGRVLDLRVESETYPITPAGLQADFARAGDMPFVDIVATLDEPRRQAALLVLNRDITDERELSRRHVSVANSTPSDAATVPVVESPPS
jgi:alpha-L-arabinofuranosidase